MAISKRKVLVAMQIKYFYVKGKIEHCLFKIQIAYKEMDKQYSEDYAIRYDIFKWLDCSVNLIIKFAFSSNYALF